MSFRVFGGYICLSGRRGSRAAAPKQAVVETSLGTFIIDLTPEVAPNQVAFFIKTAQDGGYDGTTFHTMFKNGMVQGGDPLSKDPREAKPVRNRRAESSEGGAARGRV